MLKPPDRDPRAEGARKPVESLRWRGSVHPVVGSVACHRGSVSIRQRFRKASDEGQPVGDRIQCPNFRPGVGNPRL